MLDVLRFECSGTQAIYRSETPQLLSGREGPYIYVAVRNSRINPQFPQSVTSHVNIYCT